MPANPIVLLRLSGNLGYEAQHGIHTLQRNNVTDWITLTEGPTGTPGILTTHQSKEVMCTALQQLLTHGKLGVSSELVSTTMAPGDALRQLHSEMRKFMVLIEPPKSLFGKPRRTFTGKIGGQQDDLVIALQLSVLTMQIFRNDDKYRRHRSLF